MLQLPKMAEEKKKEMTTKYNELIKIQHQKEKDPFGSADKDNWLIAEANVVRLDALNAVHSVLDL